MHQDNIFIFQKSDIQELTESKLYGYAIFEDSIVFGTNGLLKYRSESTNKTPPEEGRFAGIFIESESQISIKTDSTGQELIYIYENKENWFISNSFLALSEEVAKHYPLELYEPAIIGFHIKNGKQFGEQLISHKTPIKNIHLLPLTWEIKVDRQTGKLDFIKEEFFSKFNIPDDFSYSEEIVNLIQRGSGLLSAIATFSTPMVLDLSGGYDSRIVLGMLNSSKTPNSQKFIKSIESMHGDYLSASALCEQLNLSINKYKYPEKEQYLSSSESLRMYFMNSGGAYLPINPCSGTKLFNKFFFRLTGYQPSGWDAAIMGKPEKLAKSIAYNLEGRPHQDTIKNDFLETLDLLGVDTTSETSMTAYYCAIRSRFHYGRSSFKTIGHSYLLTPIMSKSFLLLDIYNRGKGLPPQNIFADIYSALGEWASKTRFEHEGKNFPESLTNNPLFSSPANITPVNYKVYGHPLEPSNNSSTQKLLSTLNFSASPDDIKKDLIELYRKSLDAKNSGLFTEEDLELIETEIHSSDNSLTHSVRKLTHFISTDAVIKIVESSKQKDQGTNP